MAKINWSWQPPKGSPKPAKLKGDAAIPCDKYTRSVVPHVEQKTERVEAGGHARGPGANVSDTLRGVNNAHDKALGELGRRAMARNPGHMKERERRKLERAQYTAPSTSVQVNTALMAPLITADLPALHTGSCDVSLRGWQQHGLNRLRGKR